MAPTLAEVVLPVPLRARFTYRLLHPSQYAHAPEVGKRVVVPFGRGKRVTGLIVALSSELPTADRGERLRVVEQVLDAEPISTEAQRALFKWLAEYYLCTDGEVLKAALPTGLKPHSQLVVSAHPDIVEAPAGLPSTERQLLEVLALEQSMTADAVARRLGVQNARPLLRSMAERGLLLLGEQMADDYRPRTQRAVSLAPALTDREALAEAFATLRRAPTQEALLLVMASSGADVVLAERELLAKTGASAGALRSLIQRGYLAETTLELTRVKEFESDARPAVLLTPAQQQALDALTTLTTAERPKPVLLHGVTGSGKTELYIALMRRALEAGRQALYLLPEIALTRQIVTRVTAALGPGVGVYHSRYTAAQRAEIWHSLLSGRYRAIIGVRSALLLPFDDLGLIVVDEEHDGSFKQHEPAPRYHARDAAVWLGHRLNIPVVLGSATPSIESYANAQSGKYSLVTLEQRAVATVPPAIERIDLKQQSAAQLSHGQISEPLLEALKQTLARGEQAIVFKNRRGFAPVLVCNHCGHVPRCLYCDVAMTFHKKQGILRCHLCGYTDERPEACGQCGHHELRAEGIGTERLEEHLAELLPQARIARMDLDTTRGREAIANLFDRLERREVDILVGTQMVTKGLDFQHVTLAAVVHADAMLSWPDFRASEISYQLLTQLAGRAGRHAAEGRSTGRLLIQTRMPAHPVFDLLEQPYGAFYTHELAARQAHDYPPLTRLVRLELRHREAAVVEAAARALADQLRALWGSAVLGPEYPLIARVRGTYRQQLLIKWRGATASTERPRLASALEAFGRSAHARVQVVVDVDPR